MRKMSKGMRVFLIIIAVFIGVGAVGAYSGLFSRGDLFGVSIAGRSSYGPYIGVVYIEGVIAPSSQDAFSSGGGYNHGWVLAQIERLIYDGDNEALMLFINSPGGGVYHTDELYLKLKEYKEKTGRPVYAALGSMAASGGYYVAAAADRIYANRNTVTGSIGVTTSTYYDISGFLERYGIKATAIASGRNKGMGDISQPMTEEQRAIFQSIVDENYDQFVGIVAEERGIAAEEVVKIADGRIYTAKQALAHSLVDQIGTMEEAMDGLRRDYDLSHCDVVNLYYVDKSLWSRILNAQSKIQLTLSGELGTVLSMTGKERESALTDPVNYYFSY